MEMYCVDMWMSKGNLTIFMQIYTDVEIVPPLKKCSLKIYETSNFKSGKYSKNNGANGLLLKIFLKSTEFAAYGEMVPMAYSL